MNSKPNDHGPSPAIFRFRRIGPVKEATLDLGRLTVIAGRNNTGKTYIAYSLYGFLKTWQHWPEVSNFFFTSSAEFSSIGAIAASLRDSGQANVPLPPSTIQEQRKLLVAKVGEAFSEENLPQVFSSRRDNFRDSSVEIEVKDHSATAIPTPTKFSMGKRSISLTHDGENLVASIDPADQSSGLGPIEYQTALAYFVFLLRDLFPDPFILSAERFGISLFYRELDFTKNQLVDVLQKLGDERSRRSVSPFLIIDRTTSRYALPIKDNIDFTRDIPEIPKKMSALSDYKLSDGIKNLIDGYYGNATDDIRFISKARGKGRSFNIPLHLASSSARGLSDLYFFLRHVATRDQLLIIDEPESHLDTQNQILFARMLARFVTAGLQVLISTHSDYLVKELNNLIMLDRRFPAKPSVAKKLGYKPDESLDPELVRAYMAEDNGLKRCEIGMYGIEMPVFDNTIDRINNVAIELSSRVGDVCEED